MPYLPRIHALNRSLQVTHIAAKGGVRYGYRRIIGPLSYTPVHGALRTDHRDATQARRPAATCVNVRAVLPKGLSENKVVM